MKNRNKFFIIFKESKEGVLDYKSLHLMKSDSSHFYFKCPNGCIEYYATLPHSVAYGSSCSIGEILTCYSCEKQWFIRNDVTNIIKKEEESYLKLLNDFEKSGFIGKHVDGVEAFKLHSERGVPVDILEISTEEMKVYEKLRILDSNRSREKRKKKNA